ncbi:helix-turn-helix domain-containing protein [Streptomyces sp. NPDC057654]|uniref:nSTAND1 domain-containing NTPase n=1 Tax=Streptomyces sp. NPDC057654 TaxID=3346196 RepID=UPI0036AADFED
MGRPEKQLDPGAGPVQRFACELRKLRQEAGLSYRAMSQRAGYSPTVLSQAAGGDRLPSPRVVRAYADACGADPDEWEERRRAAAEEEARQPAPDEGADAAAPPYRGLARYEPDDAALFFGRARLTEELVELAGRSKVTVVLGPSGSGKSSLLRAGLIPRLRTDPHAGPRPAAVRILTPGSRPPRADDPVLAPADGDGDTWLIVDQFEEVFTLCQDSGERARFIAALLAAEEPGRRLRVVLAVRADFYPHCLEHPGLAAAVRHAGLPVAPLSPGELREAIVKPAAAAGLLVERALTARLIKEAAEEPGSLPLLSHALLETWRRRRGRTLTLDAYETTGGLRGAIAQTAEALYTGLPDQRAAQARRILLRLITPGQGAPDTRSPVGRAELDAAPGTHTGHVLELLARARLVTLDENTVDLAHEALITAWPRLAQWVDGDRERLVLLRRLSDAARIWDELGREEASLYRGTRLTTAVEAFATPERHGELTALERDFIDAGLAARAREHRASSRAARRLRTLTLTGCLLLVLALIAGGIAWQQSRLSSREQRLTAARRVAQVAQGLRWTTPRTAVRLSIAAWRVAELPETRSAMVAAMAQRTEAVLAIPTTGPMEGLTSLSGDGRTLRVFSGSDRLEEWDVADHHRVASRRIGGIGGIGGNGANGVNRGRAGLTGGVSPDGRYVVRARTDDSAHVMLWDTVAGTRRELPAMARTDPNAFGVFWADSSRMLGITVGDHVELWDIQDLRRALSWKAGAASKGHVRRAANRLRLSVSRDGRLAALCGPGGRLELWDVSARRRLSDGWPRKGSVLGDCAQAVLHLSADGRSLGVLDRSGLRILDSASGRRTVAIAYPLLRSFSFSSDMRFVVAASADEVLLWRLDAQADSPADQTDQTDQTGQTGEGRAVDQREAAAPVFRHPLFGDEAASVTIDTGAGRIRYLGSGAGEEALVRTIDPGPALTAAWQPTPAGASLLSPDGRHLLTARKADGAEQFELRDTRGGDRAIRLPPVRPLPGRRGTPLRGVTPMAFSPDGRYLAYSTDAPASVTIWDIVKRRVHPSFTAAGGSEQFDALALRSLDGTLSAYGITLTGLRDLLTGKRLSPLPGPGRYHTASASLAPRPDGKLLVADDGTVVELPSGRVTHRDLRQGHGSPLLFSPDGRYLAVGNTTGEVTLWDGDARRRLGVLSAAQGAARLGGAEATAALAFSPDGRTLAVAGRSGSLRLWDLPSRQPLGTSLPTPGDEIRSIAFDRTGAQLTVAGAHTPPQRIPVAPARLIADLCARTGPLTPDDWHTYLPDLPYQKTC